MGKGKIIIIKDTANGLIENDNGVQIPFIQTNMPELFLEVGRIVKFDVYQNPDNPKDKTAYNVELQKKGKIIIIKDTAGELVDPNFGQIPFSAPFPKEQGLFDGAEVKYEIVMNGKIPTAVYVKLTAEK